MSNAALLHAYAMRALRQQLLERRRQLEREIKSHVSAVRTDAPPEPGGDQAAQIQMNETGLAEAERDTTELRDIDAALVRMENGSYGRCADCADPIVLARLEANPHALRCIGCETAREQIHGVAALPGH